MGTRGLTAVILDGTHRIAQYGQWDHYPSGQGRKALTFCREVLADDAKRASFIDAIGRCRFSVDSDHAERAAWLASVGCDGDWMNMEQAALYKARYPLLSRDHGAKILGLVAESSDDPIILDDAWTFGADSLFCEWAYVIDLTAGTLEVYRGRNKVSAVGRFAALPVESGKYTPVTLVKTYRIADLPTDDAFLSDLESKDEE